MHSLFHGYGAESIYRKPIPLEAHLLETIDHGKDSMKQYNWTRDGHSNDMVVNSYWEFSVKLLFVPALVSNSMTNSYKHKGLAIEITCS